jgi:hypothetical protein
MAPTSEWLFVSGLPKRSLKIVPVWTFKTLGAHNSQMKPPIGWDLNQTCSSFQELSNGVSHSTCTHRGRVNSRLLVVGSQIASLTLDLSFDHNLCCKCPNGSCKAIFDICTSRPFQLYKKYVNVRCFDPCNQALNFWESQRTPSSHFWECEFHPHTCLKVGLRHFNIPIDLICNKPKLRNSILSHSPHLQWRLHCSTIVSNEDFLPFENLMCTKVDCSFLSQHYNKQQPVRDNVRGNVCGSYMLTSRWYWRIWINFWYLKT